MTLNLKSRRSSRIIRWWAVCVGALVFGTAVARPSVAAPLSYTGVNLAGGEFGDPNMKPLVYGRDFIYPTESEFDYFASRGMNVFRIPFHWETIQPKAKGPLNRAETDRLKAVVKTATGKGLTVILDPHNYARYYGKVVGGPDVGSDVFADFWAKLAREFKGDRRVWFGLVNEPHDMPTEQWLNAANAAIAAIRRAGAKNRILVPGNAYTGAASWLDTWYGGPNGDWMDKVKDPDRNFVYEVHLYLDVDGSGTHREVVSPTIGSERIRKFTDWCRARHAKALLGEFAMPAGDPGAKAVDDLLTRMERDRDVWIGFTWWAAGAWWGDYMFSLEPKEGVDRPQMAYLKPHLQALEP